MYQKLMERVDNYRAIHHITEERKIILKPLVDFVQQKVHNNQEVRINFICTHNSRRSHLSQIWAQVAAVRFHIPQVQCYSGGTEETSLFPTVVETLSNQGFEAFKIADGLNAVYGIKYDDDSQPIIAFSKKYDSRFNPTMAFAAVMTCSQADVGCPFIVGAEKRIPITYEDPKSSDGTPDQQQIYAERSLQIAAEMFYVFSKINIQPSCSQN